VTDGNRWLWRTKQLLATLLGRDRLRTKPALPTWVDMDNNLWCRREIELDLNPLIAERSLRAPAPGVRRGRLRVPEAAQTVIDITDARLIGLLVDDQQPFDVRHGQTPVHERPTGLPG
jgi:hypothetical protein